MGCKVQYRGFNERRKAQSILIHCADIYFGLPKKEVRKLFNELTVNYNLSLPQTWDDNKTAIAEWFRMFMKRNPELFPGVSIIRNRYKYCSKARQSSG